jgi:hypothetical protein
MTRFLSGMLCGLLLGIGVSGCVPRITPVLTVAVPQPCPDGRDLPYLLDGSVSNDDIVCIGVWEQQPLDTLRCMRVGELRALIGSLGKT